MLGIWKVPLALHDCTALHLAWHAAVWIVTGPRWKWRLANLCPWGACLAVVHDSDKQTSHQTKLNVLFVHTWNAWAHLDWGAQAGMSCISFFFHGLAQLSILLLCLGHKKAWESDTNKCELLGYWVDVSWNALHLPCWKSCPNKLQKLLSYAVEQNTKYTVTGCVQ